MRVPDVCGNPTLGQSSATNGQAWIWQHAATHAWARPSLGTAHAATVPWALPRAWAQQMLPLMYEQDADSMDGRQEQRQRMQLGAGRSSWRHHCCQSCTSRQDSERTAAAAATTASSMACTLMLPGPPLVHQQEGIGLECSISSINSKVKLRDGATSACRTRMRHRRHPLLLHPFLCSAVS